jgi:hypothetical protein
MANKIYISAPLTREWSDVFQLRERLQINFKDVRTWNRNVYKPEDFDKADDVVFMLPHNSVSWYIKDLPAGVKKEVREAVSAGKRIHIAYKSPLSGNYEITEAKIDGGFDKGFISIIPGFSSETIYDYSDKSIDAVAEIEKLLRGESKTVDGILHYSNPCAEIPLSGSYTDCLLPTAKIAYVTTVANPDYIDERLLMLA